MVSQGWISMMSEVTRSKVRSCKGFIDHDASLDLMVSALKRQWMIFRAGEDGLPSPPPPKGNSG